MLCISRGYDIEINHCVLLGNSCRTPCNYYGGCTLFSVLAYSAIYVWTCPVVKEVIKHLFNWAFFFSNEFRICRFPIYRCVQYTYNRLIKLVVFFPCSGVHNDVKWSNLHPVNLVKQLRQYGASFPIDTVLEMMKRVNNPLNHLKYYISQPPLWSYFLIKPSDQKGGYFFSLAGYIWYLHKVL